MRFPSILLEGRSLLWSSRCCHALELPVRLINRRFDDHLPIRQQGGDAYSRPAKEFYTLARYAQFISS